MLGTLIIWGYSLALFYVYGRGGLMLLRKLFRLQGEKVSPGPIIIIVGMAILTTLASYLSLFIPLGLLAAALILAGGILIAAITRPWRDIRLPSYHFMVWILLVAAVLTILENATHVPGNSDTALYHAQAIHWIESFHVAPGLVNLQDRLGFNSSWFILNAVFSFAFLEIQSFHLSSSALLVAATAYFIEGPQSLLQRKWSTAALAKTSFIPFSFYVFGAEISSPGTDLPALIFVLVIIAYWLDKHERGANMFDAESIAIVMLAIFAITIKLSVLPVTLIAIWIVLQQVIQKDWARVIRLCLANLLVISPWLIRSIITSGYLIFPLYQVDIFTFDWKFPKDSAQALSVAIATFARFPVKNWAKFIGLPATEWIPIWFFNLTRNQQFLLAASLLSPMSLFGEKLAPSNPDQRKPYILALAVSWLGILFWFFTAPDIRFGYGFLGATIILAVSFIASRVSFPILKSSMAVPLTLLSLMILFQGYMFATSLDTATLPQRVLLPADYLPSRADPCPIYNGTVFCRKEGGQCNYDDFPCIPSPRPNVEMRGPSLQDGFRTIQTP